MIKKRILKYLFSSLHQIAQINNGEQLKQQCQLILSEDDPEKSASLIQNLNLALKKIDFKIPNLDQVNLDYQDFPSYKLPSCVLVMTAKEISEQIKQKSIPQNISLVHSIAHIEYNAMKSYLDTSIRFYHQIPVDLQQQFLKEAYQVSNEESEHFIMLIKRLKQAGFYYGVIPVHGGLLENVKKSQQNILDRLVLISLVQEGKGVDAGPRLINKLTSWNDRESLQILKIILRDEIKHIKFGRYWFETICQRQNKLSKTEEFKQILQKYNITLDGKFNIKDRKKAGFDDDWLKNVYNHSQFQ